MSRISPIIHNQLLKVRTGDTIVACTGAGVKQKGEVVSYDNIGECWVLVMQNIDTIHNDSRNVKVTTHTIDADEIIMVTTFEVRPRTSDMNLRRTQPRRRDRQLEPMVADD